MNRVFAAVTVVAALALAGCAAAHPEDMPDARDSSQQESSASPTPDRVAPVETASLLPGTDPDDACRKNLPPTIIDSVLAMAPTDMNLYLSDGQPGMNVDDATGTILCQFAPSPAPSYDGWRGTIVLSVSGFTDTDVWAAQSATVMPGAIELTGGTVVASGTDSLPGVNAYYGVGAYGAADWTDHAEYGVAFLSPQPLSDGGSYLAARLEVKTNIPSELPSLEQMRAWGVGAAANQEGFDDVWWAAYLAACECGE